jgi:multicomponent Na+:H+ antiporter subunit D
MNALIVPVLVPFLAALVLALLNGWRRLERAVAVVATLGLAAWSFWLLWLVDTHGIQATVIGGWQAPWGVAFVADRLAAILLCLSMSIGSVVTVYTLWTVTDQQQRYFFYPLMQLLMLGVNWSFVTGDLFNLFVAYEVMLMASYGMMIVGATKPQIRQTFKYMGINSIGSTLFVVACGVIYATTGTLNMADLAARTELLTGARAAMVTSGSMVLLVVFAMKAAMFPLIYWLPDSYPVVPAGANGYFAGLLTKVGVYSLLRVYVMLFRQEGAGFALDVVLALSGLTMLLGVLGAMCQWEIRRILAWHSVSQVGYMVMGIGLAGSADPRVVELAIVGTIVFVVHHGIVKSSLFLIGGIAERVSGSQSLERMGGVLTIAPGVAGLFLVSGLSLAGMPPFSGFLSKLLLVRAGLAGGQPAIVAVSVVTSFLTLYSMMKIWSYGFWGALGQERAVAGYRALMVPTAALVLATTLLGSWAQPFLGLATRAAASLTDPREYIEAVMHGHAGSHRARLQAGRTEMAGLAADPAHPETRTVP